MNIEASGLVRQLTDDRVVRQLADGSTQVQPTFKNPVNRLFTGFIFHIDRLKINIK